MSQQQEKEEKQEKQEKGKNPKKVNKLIFDPTKEDLLRNYVLLIDYEGHKQGAKIPLYHSTAIGLHAHGIVDANKPIAKPKKEE